MKPSLEIMTEQQPDTSWKAWAVGGCVVVNSQTKENAVATLKMFFEGREKEQTKYFDTTHQDISL